jgi:ABC-type transport system substrate-binding protein
MKYITLIIVAGFVVLSSCFRQKDISDDIMIFCYNEPANITSLDPAYSRSMANIWGVHQIFNGLVQLDDSLHIAPCIAESWEISSDGLNYTFFLRNDVFFHADPSVPSGRRVVAGDVVYSFNRILDPDVASPGTWIFQNVKRDSLGNPHFVAVNDSVFSIVLDHPFSPFIGLLAMQYCSVLPHEAIEYYGQDFRKHPVGTGPFQFAFWKENVKLVLVKNPLYFETDSAGKRLPYLDAVNITFIVDRQTAFLDFLKGNIHMISGIDASYKDALLNRDGTLKEKYHDQMYLQTELFLNTEYLGFQMDEKTAGFKNPALSDVRVRQAINYCFDREKMMRYLRNNMGIPGIYGFVPPRMPGFGTNHTYGYNYNPGKAGELLAEAGYPEGKGLEPVVLTTTSNYLDLCQYIQHEAQKLGIHIQIEVTQPATLREMNAKGEVSFFRASWIADYPDAENYLGLFYSKNFAPEGPNYTHFSSSEFDRLFEEAIITTSDSIRFKLYRQLDSMVMMQAPVIVLYYDQVVRFVRKEVSGIHSNPMNLLTLKKTRIDSKNTPKY